METRQPPMPADVMRQVLAGPAAAAGQLALDRLLDAVGCRQGLVARVDRRASAGLGTLELHGSVGAHIEHVGAALLDAASIHDQLLSGEVYRGPLGTLADGWEVLCIPCRRDARTVGLVCLVGPPDVDTELLLESADMWVALLEEVLARSAPGTSTSTVESPPDGGHSLLLQSSRFAVILLSDDGLILDASRSAPELFGVSAGRLVGQPVAHWLPQLGGKVDRWLQNPGGVRTLVCHGRHTEAGAVPYEVSLARVEGSAQVVVAVSDLSERHALEVQLRRAQRTDALGALAGGMAHDFNNLLTVILGNASTALPQVAPDSEAYRDLDNILTAGRQAARLTRRLLDFGRRRSDLKAMDINALVQDLEFLVGHLVPRHIRIKQELASHLPSALVDMGQFEQVMLNLMVNASDAMPHGGLITVRTTSVALDGEQAASVLELEPGHYVRVDVIDTGPGMTPAVIQRAFEPFFTTKEDGIGTGLGLATVRRIVSAHGGAVYIDSELGEGTTVCTLWPVSAQPAAAPTRRRTPEPEVRRRQRVLVVEDNAQVRRYLVSVLGRAGLEAIEAESGDAAWAMLAQDERVKDIDLLVTDVIMPGMSGLALAERVQERFPACRTLFISGGATPIPIPRDDGRYRKLSKPFSPDDFMQAVSAALRPA